MSKRPPSPPLSAALSESHRLEDSKKMKVEGEGEDVHIVRAASKQAEKPSDAVQLSTQSFVERKLEVGANEYHRLLRRHKYIVGKHKKEIEEKDYHIRVLQANCRQYRRKAQNIRDIATAACTRDEMICELSGSKMESGEANDATIQLSDNEDEGNNVKYSYIDQPTD